MSSPTKKGLQKHDRTHTGGKSPKLDVPKKGGAGMKKNHSCSDLRSLTIFKAERELGGKKALRLMAQ